MGPLALLMVALKHTSDPEMDFITASVAGSGEIQSEGAQGRLEAYSNSVRRFQIKTLEIIPGGSGVGKKSGGELLGELIAKLKIGVPHFLTDKFSVFISPNGV